MTEALIDIGMTVLLMTLMAYHLTGNKLHEWLGVLLFLLFVWHHVCNWNWYRSLGKGNYTAVRSLHMAVNVLLTMAMLAILASGVMLSREVFGFLDISAGRLGRRLHMAASMWGFLLIAVHLGLHGDRLIGAAKKLTNAPGKNPVYGAWAARLAAVILSAYGLYAFFSRGLWEELFLIREYPLFDYEEPAMAFFTDYLTVLALFACAAYGTLELLRNKRYG
jgi:hypothetical protein